MSKEKAEYVPNEKAIQSESIPLLWPEYSSIQPCVVEGSPDAHTVWLKVGVQSFCITPLACDTKEEAEWMRRMLDKAIETMKKNFTSSFVEQVEREAENNMLKTGKLEGAHYAAMKRLAAMP